MFPSGQFGWQPKSILLNLNVDPDEPVLSDQLFDDDEVDDCNALDEQTNTSENQITTENTPDNDEISDYIPNKKMKFVSAMQYYSYQLCDRPNNYLHYFGRLFHQYIVDQFAKIELGRLYFFRFNQDQIRADKYQNIKNKDPDSKGKNSDTRIV